MIRLLTIFLATLFILSCSTPEVRSQFAEWQEIDGLVVIEAEHTASSLDEWVWLQSVDDFRGTGHLEFTGNQFTNGPATSPLEYTFTVTKSGLYRLIIRSHKRMEEDTEPDWCNDSYVRLEGDFNASPDAKDSAYAPASLSILQEDTKMFGGSDAGWGWTQSLDPSVGKRIAIYDLNAGEEYIFVMSGRSKNYNVDQIIFYHLDDYSLTEVKNIPHLSETR